MRKKYIFGKKLYISILTSILVLFTTVATTFAWVGVFANSSFETFDFNIKASSLEEYTIEISDDGVHFSNSISFDKIKKQILTNWGYTDVDSLTSKQIDARFINLNQDQCTTVPQVVGNKIKKLGDFIDIEGNPTSRYFKFDIYISAKKNYDSGTTTNFSMNVFLGDGLLKGNKKNYFLKNPFTYPNTFTNPYDELPDLSFLTDAGYRTIQANEVMRAIKVDSASSARLAFEKFNVVQKGHPELYDSDSEPKSAVIYQDSYEYPVVNEEEGTYSFGAIVPDDYNLAVGYYNSTEYQYWKYRIKSVSVPDEILNTRSVDGVTPDIRLTSQTNKLIDSENVDEQVGVDTMMKLRVYFWFEGWDADCCPVINHSPVDINISLLMKNEKEFN